VKEVYSFNEIEDKKLERITNSGVDTGNQSEVEDRKQCAIKDLATIIYTSGTTGRQKE
jgi:long-subunit acyl-CoA synthetase (AMP-forming)